MNKHIKLFTIFFSIYLLFNFPISAFAETYIYSEIGNRSFSKSDWPYCRLYAPQTVDLTPILINSPDGTSFMKISGQSTLKDTRWDYGLVDEDFVFYLTFYGVRSDGSLGESCSINWNGWETEGEFRDFEKVFQESYVKLKIVPSVYFWSRENNEYNTLEYYYFTGSVTFWSGGYIPSKETYNSIINATNTAATNATNAANAANAAKTSANTAAARSYYNGNTSGYWSYNSYTKANSANTNAANAVNMLNGSSNGGKSLAATYDKANNANNNAYTAAVRVWDSTEGKSAATLSKEARDKANAASQDTTYIRNTQLPSLENKIANLETTVNNINNNIGVDNLPPTMDWVTVSGAYATSGSSISIIITASDNVSSNLEYSINGGAYSALPADGIVSAPVTSTGPVVVRVRDESGNVASKARTVWKL